MLATIDLRSRPLGARELRAALPRAEYDVEAALDAVRPICDDVHDRGAQALYEYAERFDGVRPTSLRVPPHVLEAALDTLDDDVRAALEISIERARAVHADQRRVDTTTRLHPGGTVTERWVPVERVGLYVPGGRAVYPSSVVMNVVPAQLAGVGSIAVASPPQRDNVGDLAGYPHPTILAACALLGVDEVWAMGGAQAVAGFAHGFEDTSSGETVACAPVSLVTGPGNIYVAAAKRLLKGLIGIDAEAGPTEIAVLADATGAADLHAVDRDVEPGRLEDRGRRAAGVLRGHARAGGLRPAGALHGRGRVHRRAQERQTLLIAELNHRVRNILGLIKGLVRQSRSDASTVRDEVCS